MLLVREREAFGTGSVVVARFLYVKGERDACLGLYLKAHRVAVRKFDANVGPVLVHRLARLDLKRNTVPTVRTAAKRNSKIRFCLRIDGARMLRIRSILSAIKVCLVICEWIECRKNLFALCPDLRAIKLGRSVPQYQREHLQRMVLPNVTQRTHLIIKFTAPFNTTLFQ